MTEIINIIGKKGLIAISGVMFFMFVFHYSVGIFDWIERQTFGTRSYIEEKLELLFIEVKSEHITYALLFLSVGLGTLTVTIFGLFGMWTLGFVIGGILSFVGFKAPKPFIDYLVEKRIKEYSLQMVDGLTLLANGLRAGLSVPQALGMVVNEMKAPISQEFGVMLKENKIGTPLEECFENLVKRIPTEDNEMFVSSVNILRETGGNLAEVFDTIIDVIRERVRLQQKIDTYVAQGKFQGYTIALMPYVITAISAASDPKAVTSMFQHPAGIAMMVAAVVLDLTGLFVILKVVKIKL